MLLSVEKAMASHFVECTSALAGRLYITLPWPPSVNHIWRQAGGRVHLDQKVEAFRQNVQSKVLWMKKNMLFPSDPIECNCAVMVEYLTPDKRRRDIDNGLKVVLDAFTHAGVWKDDSQVKLMLVYFGKSCKGGAVNVLIQPLEVD